MDFHSLFLARGFAISLSRAVRPRARLRQLVFTLSLAYALEILSSRIVYKFSYRVEWSWNS